MSLSLPLLLCCSSWCWSLFCAVLVVLVFLFFICIHIYMYIYVYIYIYIYMYIYVCIYIYIYTHTYIYIYTFVLWWNARMHDDSNNVILCLCSTSFLLTWHFSCITFCVPVNFLWLYIFRFGRSSCLNYDFSTGFFNLSLCLPVTKVH